MILGIDPTLDCVFKLLFGCEAQVFLSIDLVNAVTAPPPGRLATGLDFLNPQSERQTLHDKQTVADIKLRDQSGRHYQLEMQDQVPQFFGKRVLYYWSQLHAQQLRAGEHYQTLCKTACICFLNQALFADTGDYHHTFRLREEKRGLVLTEDLDIHVIELPKFTKRAEELTSPLERWCYFLRHAGTLDPEHLPPTLDVPIIRQALEVLKVFTQEDRERERYEAELKAKRDRASWLREATEIGLEKGLLVGQIQIFQQMQKLPLTPLAALTGMPVAELTALHARLRDQMGLNGTAHQP